MDTYWLGPAIISASCPRGCKILRSDTFISGESRAATKGYKMECRCINSNSTLVREGGGMLRAVTRF